MCVYICMYVCMYVYMVDIYRCIGPLLYSKNVLLEFCTENSSVKKICQEI